MSSCSGETPYVESGNACSQNCSSGKYTNNGSLTCSDSCPTYFIINSSSGMEECVSVCPAGSQLNATEDECVAQSNKASDMLMIIIAAGVAVAAVAVLTPVTMVYYHHRKRVNSRTKKELLMSQYLETSGVAYV